jgi:hypothetical protein
MRPTLEPVDLGEATPIPGPVAVVEDHADVDDRLAAITNRDSFSGDGETIAGVWSVGKDEWQDFRCSRPVVVPDPACSSRLGSA